MWYPSFPFFFSSSSSSWWITKVLLFHSSEWSLLFLSVGFSIMAQKWLLAHSLIPKSFFLRKKKPFIPDFKASGALQTLCSASSCQPRTHGLRLLGLAFVFIVGNVLKLDDLNNHGHSTQWSLNQSCPDSPGRHVQGHPSGIQSQASALGLWESHF